MRIKIEHAFGMLKARLPILRQLPIKITNGSEDHMQAIRYIFACIVIHNFCQRQEGDWDFDVVRNIGQAAQSQAPAPGSTSDKERGKERCDTLR